MSDSLIDRRRSHRSPARSLSGIECRRGSLGRGPNVAVAALDLSEKGIRLVTRELLKAGQNVEILLFTNDLARPARRLGRVAWSIALTGNNYCMGVAFDKPLTSLWWQAAVSPALLPS
jgi:hypothetical protein